MLLTCVLMWFEASDNSHKESSQSVSRLNHGYFTVVTLLVAVTFVNFGKLFATTKIPYKLNYLSSFGGKTGVDIFKAYLRLNFEM